MKTPITGNTYPVKDELRAMGGTWDKKRQAWMVPLDMKEEAEALVAGAGRKVRRTVIDDSRYISHIFNINGQEYYRNKNGICEDAPCCGCCTI